MKKNHCYLNAMGIVCAAGSSVQQIKDNMHTGKVNLTPSDAYHKGTSFPLGKVTDDLPNIPTSDKKWNSRNNRMALAALEQIRPQIDSAIKQYGAHRVAVIIGTSTSGINESERAIEKWLTTSVVPESYDYGLQEMGAPAQFIANELGATGPTYGISTACSSGAKALATARRLLQAGLCDAVVAGGVDTLCQLTVQGFSSLQAISTDRCNPFRANRNGINIGEGAALFLVSQHCCGVELIGSGESSDAHHISAPEPNGKGAIKCMQESLKDANVCAENIDYINLHGTATELNDQMESRAIAHVFTNNTLCSSTKPFTGHTLGAAGAIDAGICWMMLDNTSSSQFVPPHLWDGQRDPQLPSLNLASLLSDNKVKINTALSNSFAFGGNNISLIFGRIQ